VPLFGPVHLSLVAAILGAAVALSWACRERKVPARALRLALGYGIAANEVAWWIYRYSREGVHVTNLPLQLSDLAVWMAVLACLTLHPLIVDFAYFAGLTGSSMAILTPDLWSPWPSYPAMYFFVAHGGVLVACSVLVFGKVAVLNERAIWRAFGLLAAYAALVGAFDANFHTNYMYLRRKPAAPSLLDFLGPWPLYLAGAAVLGLLFFWLLWLPVRRQN
jgi:hypothetical integral membrane protein (TIGR02206 family)